FLLFAGILAITQEADETELPDEPSLDEMLAALPEEEEGEGGFLPDWEPPGPPRWFRSNAGGMALEEIPSRLTALHHKYALVIDYLPPHEIEPRLLPYYQDDFIVETRILYEQGVESRRQWLFRGEAGVARLNAVFIERADEAEDEEIAGEEIAQIEPIESIEPEDDESGDLVAETASAGEPEEDTSPAPINHATVYSTGFIELFDEFGNITTERQFFDDDSETVIIYSYNFNIMVKAEARERKTGDEFHTAYIDYYRYNRSYSLRHVERRFFEAAYRQPIRLTFPGRVLDAARDDSFFSDKLAVTSDFFGVLTVNEGYRIIYTTDSRGRILTQTMFNNRDEEVWVITNTWSGDRIAFTQKTEGDEIKITEYEYDGEGDRIVQRDLRDGVLERLVLIDGVNETEELYLDGKLALKAYWEDGKKVSEERVRR
ncbi:MAG: hypothetical protein FWF55_04820, partial [Treponema sp.]|nr:hypothetical protein [Treponema sp.]